MNLNLSLIQNTPSMYLPEDLFVEMTHYLSPKEILATRSVCKLWKFFNNCDEIWKYQSEKKWPNYIKLSQISWKEHFSSNYLGSFIGSLNYYERTIIFTENNRITEMDVFTRSKKEYESDHLGSINQLLIFNCPRFEVKFLTCSSDGFIKMFDEEMSHPPLISQKAHDQGVNCLDILNQYILSGSEDHTIRLWYLHIDKSNQIKSYSLKLLSELKSHQGPITCLQISKENLTEYKFYSASQDKTIKIWKFSHQHFLRLSQTLEGHTSAITALKVHSRANCLLSGSVDGTIRIWSPKTNEQYECTHILKNHYYSLTSIIADPLEHIFYSSSLDGLIIGWKFLKEENNWIPESTNFSKHRKIHCLRFQQSGLLYLVPNRICSLASNGDIEIWMINTKSLVLTIDENP